MGNPWMDVVTKVKKNNPNVCLIPRETITTSDAAINVIKAFFVLKNFSELI